MSYCNVEYARAPPLTRYEGFGAEFALYLNSWYRELLVVNFNFDAKVFNRRKNIDGEWVEPSALEIATKIGAGRLLPTLTKPK